MSITLSLAMSMRRMLRTNNLVRRMHACETMGAVTVICTDKTGTLTRNCMAVQEAFTVAGTDDERLAEAVALNTTAFLDGEGRPVGNPTEGALLEWLRRRGYDYEALRDGAVILDRITFSSQRKYMATLYRTVAGTHVLAVKGAPEIVRAMCRPDGEEERMRGLFRRFSVSGHADAGRRLGRNRSGDLRRGAGGRRPALSRLPSPSRTPCGRRFPPR